MGIKMNELFLVLVLSAIGCSEVDDQVYFTDFECEYSSEISLPGTFSIEVLNSGGFEGSIIDFTMSSDEVGYFVMSRFYDAQAEIGKTLDGGTTWTLKFSEPVKRPRDIFFTNESIGLASFGYTSGGNLYKTVDGGETWSLRASTYITGFLDHFCKDSAGNLYAIHVKEARLGEIVKSEDQGETWVRIGNQESVKYSESNFCLELYDDLLYVMSNKKKIEVRKLDANPETSFDIGLDIIQDIKVIDRNNFVLSSNKELRISNDRGVTWKQIHEGSNSIVLFDSPSIGLAVLNKSYCQDYDVFYSNDVMAYTDDGGESWIESEVVTSSIAGLTSAHQRVDGSHVVRLGNSIFLLKR